MIAGMAVTAARGEPAPAFRLRRILAGFALPELSLLLFYAANAVALACVCAVRPAPRERFHLGLVVAFGVLYAVLARSLRTRPRNEHLRRTLRRFVSLCALFGIYFQLRWIIPAVHPGDLDAQLHEIDVALLGAPAAELLAPYQPRFWVEWFAFFYWTYFYVIGAYILGHLFLQRDGRRFATFGWGIAAIHIVGWSAYFLVPGLVR
jgi:hypothetical protein